MNNKAYTEPVYLISAVAEILSIHPQTLRQYEREGFVNPTRSNGKIRLYSQKDIDHIKYILTLTREFGINLAGVDLILQLNKKIKNIEKELDEYKEKFKNIDKYAVVPSAKALVVKKSSYDMIVFEE